MRSGPNGWAVLVGGLSATLAQPVPPPLPPLGLGSHLTTPPRLWRAPVMSTAIAAVFFITAASTASMPLAVPCLAAGLALAVFTGARK